MPKTNLKIDVIEEPEIQYEATPALFDEIENWLKERGGFHRKTQEDQSDYFDTRNFRLLREGIEYRIKAKKNDNKIRYDHDMKTPRTTKLREVQPDENHILWRNEIKIKGAEKVPCLGLLFGQAVLKPLARRVYKLFDKELEHKFTAIFEKRKIDIDTVCGHGRVEYSFQRGFMQTPDASSKTQEYFILELELRDGTSQSLLEEKIALEEVFFKKGLAFLPERKVILGMALLEPTMTNKQKHAFWDARNRNRLIAEEDLPLLAA